ncbi:hypothetical protein [Lentilactobacillus senioris]|uniref:hypothetical protein n=1 Tax=Lentilactobacillus senioris TaxID=931534 RepID=UPI003D293C07
MTAEIQQLIKENGQATVKFVNDQNLTISQLLQPTTDKFLVAKDGLGNKVIVNIDHILYIY